MTISCSIIIRCSAVPPGVMVAIGSCAVGRERFRLQCRPRRAYRACWAGFAQVAIATCAALLEGAGHRHDAGRVSVWGAC
eukprot:4697078-Prymnesium_polylepis.1